MLWDELIAERDLSGCWVRCIYGTTVKMDHPYHPAAWDNYTTKLDEVGRRQRLEVKARLVRGGCEVFLVHSPDGSMQCAAYASLQWDLGRNPGMRLSPAAGPDTEDGPGQVEDWEEQWYDANCIRSISAETHESNQNINWECGLQRQALGGLRNSALHPDRCVTMMIEAEDGELEIAPIAMQTGTLVDVMPSASTQGRRIRLCEALLDLCDLGSGTDPELMECVRIQEQEAEALRQLSLRELEALAQVSDDPQNPQVTSTVHQAAWEIDRVLRLRASYEATAKQPPKQRITSGRSN